VLAYVFWHRSAPGVASAEYEAANVRFQRALTANAPGGFVASACLSAGSLPWLGDGGPGYEDWYVVEDFAALGVLNGAALGRGNRTAHDAAARLMGEGTGGLYRLLDGAPRFELVANANWITPTRGPDEAMLEDFLADGMDRDSASLWRRLLALGPAPELCLLAGEMPAGVRSTRLPEGWLAEIGARAAL
jgi:putative intracellular protease/amidase